MKLQRTPALLSFVLLLSGTGRAEDLEGIVDAAIDRGVDHLLRAVEGPGGWSPAKEFPIGHAALQVYALLKCDVAFQHPIVEKGLAILDASPLQQTYSVALIIMAYGALLDQVELEQKLGGTRHSAARARGLERMGAALDWLIAARLRGSGAWNYDPPSPRKKRRGNRYDHSNTQFAVLALGVAAEHGLKVPAEIWAEIADHFLAEQEKDGAPVSERPVFRDGSAPAPPAGAGGAGAGGKTSARRTHPLYAGESIQVAARGWRYTPREKGPTFSMTCGGLSSLLIADRGLRATGGTGGRAEALRRALRDGYGAVTITVNREKIDGLPRFSPFYDLYSLEKVGDLGEVEAFGPFAWYEEGARRLVRKQRADGGWGPEGNEALSRPDSALALLFLARATDLTGRARALARATSAGGAGGATPSSPEWVYLPSQKGEVPLSRLFRFYALRPSTRISRMVAEALQVGDPERLGDLVARLAAAVERSPFAPQKAEALKLLAQATGVERPDAKGYRDWAARYQEVIRIGKEKDSRRLDLLRERLRAPEGTPLLVKTIWAIERTAGKEALPELVDLLDAADPAVREASHSALVFLAGLDLPFHPRGGEKGRAEELRAIRDWLLRGGGSKRN